MDEKLFEFIKKHADYVTFDFERGDVEIGYKVYSIYGDNLREVHDNFKNYLEGE